MKRPPGIWLLLSAGVLWLSIQNVYGLKATALIFGKTTTTTTTTEAGSENKDEGATEAPVEETTIKSNLTGNPQLDYIYDPNLPRELNGYNLSSYPFFSSMPDDIVFKCDGLHDGFYASVPHKCQVYHHCLFGTRFDFLCANYTAFDQKTFICHFASEVDCTNSPKYWFRNDVLYQAASTTTVAPTPIVISPALTASPRRPPPGLRRRNKPLRRRPQYEYYDDEYDEDREEDYEEPPPRRRRKRPRPRRPIYEDDYEEYDDDRYDRRPSRRNEDDDRKPHDRRDSDNRRGSDSDRKQNDDRKDSNDRRSEDDKKTSDDRRVSDDDRKPYDRRDSDTRRSSDNDRKQHDDRKESNDRRSDGDKKSPDDRRAIDDDRKPHDRKEADDRQSERKPFNRREPEDRRNKDDRRRDYDSGGRYDTDDDDYRYDRDRRKDDDRKPRPDDDLDNRRSPGDKRPSNDRRSENRRPADDSHDRPRKSHRRPYDDDLYEDDVDEDRRVHSRPRKSESRDDYDQDETPLVKPNSGASVFSKPRMPPKIRPPVPKNEQSKIPYKPTTDKPVSKRPEDDEEYDEYEEEPPKRSNSRTNRKPDPDTSESRRPNKPASTAEREEKRDNRRPLGSASRHRAQMSRRPPADTFDDSEDKKPRARPHTRPRHDSDNKDSKVKTNTRNRSSGDDDISTTEKEDGRTSSFNNEERSAGQFVPKFVPKGRTDKPKPETTSSTTTTTTTTTKEPPRQRSEPFVKVVKRPFLPSRGGSPYSARGLQPVGAKALDGNTRNSPPTQQEPDTSKTDYIDNLEPETPYNEQKSTSKYKSDISKPLTEDYYYEPKQTYKEINAANEQTENNYKPTTENPRLVQNGRQFPTSTESKVNSFLINEQPIDQRKSPLADISTKQVYEPTYQTKEPEPPEEKPFKASPVIVKVPIRLKYSDPIDNEDEEEFRPVSNRPQSSLRQNNKPSAYQESRTTEKPIILEKNPLDITENEYDVTLNDALNPTIPNLPVRNFPSGFSAAQDYTFSAFNRPGYDVTLNQATENRYQVRAPSQKIESVAEPYVNRGDHKYVNLNPQYDTPSDQIYQNQNFRSSPQLTQAQTHAYYNVY